jgi:hypothetical protein
MRGRVAWPARWRPRRPIEVAGAEQTVYNYFPAKEQFVTDLEAQVQSRVCELILARPPGRPAARLQGIALAGVFQILIDEAGPPRRPGRELT